MKLPKNNQGAVIGAIAVAVLVAAAQGFLRFLESGQPFPVTAEGWVRVIGPSVLAGALAAVTPFYSRTEAETGHRSVTTPPDAPVVNE